MNYEFDFNVNNYTIDELEHFLKLENKYDFELKKLLAQKVT